MAIAKVVYKPQPFSGRTLEELTNYVQNELESIKRGFMGSLNNPLDELHVEPGKVFTGLTVLADGTDWNPGSGQGVYTYYAAAWHKLG